MPNPHYSTLSKDYYVLGRFIGGVVAFGLVIAVILGFMSATTIGARSVGIQTQFGQYKATLDSGFHWTSPFSSVEEFSTQIQDLDLEVPVSFEGGSSGSAKLTVLWAIDAKDAEQLWKDWKTFDRVRDRLVAPAARTVTAASFSAYAPNDARDGKNRVALQDSILDALKKSIGSGANIRSIQLTDVQLSPQAQAAVDRIVEATANTARALEEQKRATTEAETARIRQSSQTPEALQRYCLEVVNSWNVGKNGPLPATFDCSLGGTSAPVIVGGN
jgi:regulator of protease activity HflC (stomatin/prohibitin superfamily)